MLQSLPGQVLPNNGIIAGCTQSTTFHKVYLKVVLQGLWDKYQAKMAYGITSKPQEGLGNAVRTFVDDISATTHCKRHYDPVTKRLCIITIHARMAAELAQGIAALKGKVSPETAIIGTSIPLRRLLHKDYKKIGIRATNSTCD